MAAIASVSAARLLVPCFECSLTYSMVAIDDSEYLAIDIICALPYRSVKLALPYSTPLRFFHPQLASRNIDAYFDSLRAIAVMTRNNSRIGKTENLCSPSHISYLKILLDYLIFYAFNLFTRFFVCLFWHIDRCVWLKRQNAQFQFLRVSR